MVLSIVNSDNVSQRKFLLIVDRNRSSSSSVKAMLKQFRYKVWSVPTAGEALELCDIVMPALVILRQTEDMAPVDFIEALRRLDPARTCAVIVVKGSKDTIDERGCLAAGAVTCLQLPLNLETFYRTVQVAIEPVPRMNLRINTTLPVLVNDAAANTTRAYATTLSECGLFLPTPEPCPLKTKLSLSIKVAGKVVSADAVVIYAHKQGERAECKPGMGLQFVRISDQEQAEIRHFIRDEVRKCISASQH